jgi:acetoin utilization deacetylase AcuC-like enzyme
LVSAGFDAFLGDPLGGLAVTAAGFASATALLLGSAQRCCEGRICFVLEGGYSPTGLKECVKAVMTQMESSDAQERAAGADPLFDTISKKAQGEFGEHWTW